MHVLRILSRVPWTPHIKNRRPQPWDEIKEEVADAHLRYVQRLAPSFTNDMILARTIVTPPDLYRMNPHAYQGCLISNPDGPSQLGDLRPVPGWAQHRMPIHGLYQTGGMTHPGLEVTGGPGRNAAWVMLEDFGMNIEEVIARKEKG